MPSSRGNAFPVRGVIFGFEDLVGAVVEENAYFGNLRMRLFDVLNFLSDNLFGGINYLGNLVLLAKSGESGSSVVFFGFSNGWVNKSMPVTAGALSSISPSP